MTFEVLSFLDEVQALIFACVVLAIIASFVGCFLALLAFSFLPVGRPRLSFSASQLDLLTSHRFDACSCEGGCAGAAAESEARRGARTVPLGNTGTTTVEGAR